MAKDERTNCPRNFSDLSSQAQEFVRLINCCFLHASIRPQNANALDSQLSHSTFPKCQCLFHSPSLINNVKTFYSLLLCGAKSVSMLRCVL